MSEKFSDSLFAKGRIDPSRISDVLRNIERRISDVGAQIADERARSGLNEVLSQVALLRSQFDVPMPGDQRQAARAPESAVVVVTSEGGRNFEAALHDLSIGGALVELEADELNGRSCQVLLPGLARSIDATASATGKGKIRLLFKALTSDDRLDLLKQIEGTALRA